MMLADTPVGIAARVERLGGDRAFRRRLMELGILPGTWLTVVGRAPFRGPLEILVRGCCLSIRREDALAVDVIVVEATRARSTGGRTVTHRPPVLVPAPPALEGETLPV